VIKALREELKYDAPRKILFDYVDFLGRSLGMRAMSKAKPISQNPPSQNKWAEFTEADARGQTKNAEEPVPGFPIKYVWHTGPWRDIFDRQIDLIKRAVRRAKVENKLVVYLSCPISSRGGGYSGTNVDVARHIERILLERWGEAFWVLNPAQYQLESKGGAGLINEHAEYLGIDLDRLKAQSGGTVGGDYMRMWTKVLVENDNKVGERTISPALANTGQNFDAFYFIGPRDVQSFFMSEGETLTAGIQAYFARKFAGDSDFRMAFSVSAIEWKQLGPRTATNAAQYAALDAWDQKRNDFLRYYSLRASANFSLGSHDEWLIFAHINLLRRHKTADLKKFMADGDVSEQVAGFFDGGQLDPPSTEAPLSRGYSV
jgi:hypothetical protein